LCGADERESSAALDALGAALLGWAHHQPTGFIAGEAEIELTAILIGHREWWSTAAYGGETRLSR